MTRSDPPRPQVLAAFGLRGRPEPVRGGQETSWRVGEVILKPETDPRLQAWLGTTLARIDQGGFRLSEVLASGTGEWVVDGWGAQNVLPGVTATDSHADWTTIIEAGRAFHGAVAGLPRPDFLGTRSDVWAGSDRAAWGVLEEPVSPEAGELVQRLRMIPAPQGVEQVVHGDLSGNVLLSSGHPPGIIDISPYWRPPSYAEGVLVADALSWFHAPPSLPRDLGVSTEAVARGLLFRVLTVDRFHRSRPATRWLQRELAAFRATADALGL